MIKCTEMTNTNSNSNSYKVSLFADTKEEVVEGATIEGFPEGATIEIGSSVLTAKGELAFRQSTGQWVWI